MYDKLKAIAMYCGEDFDPTDPSRILRVVRDFMRLFEKSLADIRVRAPAHRLALKLHCRFTLRASQHALCSSLLLNTLK